jgi:pyruvate/2-oxoglutarate dehydrogenase complex dihydrolipoamide acyltransferase (E2) component
MWCNGNRKAWTNDNWQVEEEEDVGKFKDFTGGAPAKSESKKADTSKEAKSEPSAEQAPATGPKKNRVGPSVRRYLAESGLDASSLAGTGPNGMLLKGDILSVLQLHLRQLLHRPFHLSPKV